MGKASRDKGRRGEYEIRDILKRITGIEWMRTPLSGGFHLSFPWDVMKKRQQDSSALDNVGIEVKNCATVSMPAWIRQCEEAEMDFLNFKANKWLLFSKINGAWYATMHVEQLERFIAEKQMKDLKQ